MNELLITAEKRKLAYLTNILIATIALAFAFYRIANLGLEALPLPAFLISTLVLSNSIYLSRTGDLQKASIFLIVTLYFGIGASGMNTGGFSGASVIMSPMIPVLAVFLIGPKAGWFAAIAVVILLLTLFYIQLSGGIEPSPLSETSVLGSRFFAIIFTVGVCTWLPWVFAKNNSRLIDLIHRQANTDYLTGLANRRSLEERLHLEIKRAQRNDCWLSVLVIDVDYFKRFNDKNGHKAGDECLILIANALKETLQRPTDVISRWGGEEFVAVLPDTASSGAQRVAEKVRYAIQGLSIPYEATSFEVVTLTVGVASERGNEIKDSESLIARADAALYLGKQNGRNCVEVST